jgi:hypothetical protein
LRNGQIWQQGVEFGGWHLAYSELPRNERLQIVHLPNGATGTQALYVLADNTHDIDFRTRGGSVGGAPDFIIPSDLGSRVVIAGSIHRQYIGRARIIKNDAGVTGHDADGDGLGSELESVLGTCDSLSGTTTGMDDIEFDCSIAADPKDTDGDGLRDDWEVLGLERAYQRRPNTWVHENLLLPAWGADPRHNASLRMWPDSSPPTIKTRSTTQHRYGQRFALLYYAIRIALEGSMFISIRADLRRLQTTHDYSVTGEDIRQCRLFRMMMAT